MRRIVRTMGMMGMMAGALALGQAAFGGTLPNDVKPGHWAASSVETALENGILSLESGKFNGEDKVTQGEAVIAVAKLARALESGKWKKRASVPVSEKTIKIMEAGNWRSEPVTRYTLANVLTRLGDYVTNGSRRAKPGSKDAGKSDVLPKKPTIALSRTDPAYESLRYLVEKRMLWGQSPLLKAGKETVKSGELSLALAEMVTGLNNIITDLGKEADGSTPDRTFQNKKR